MWICAFIYTINIVLPMKESLLPSSIINTPPPPLPLETSNILSIDFSILNIFSSVHSLSRVRLFATPWTAACQASLPTRTPEVYSNSCPLSQWCHPTICRPLLLPPSIFPNIGLFKWVSSSHQVAKVLEFQLQHQSFQWIFRTDFL